MFAALSQYEQRFQNIERILSRNAQLLERMDRDSMDGFATIREIRRILQLAGKKIISEKPDSPKFEQKTPAK